MRQGAVVSPWFFSVYIDGVLKEVKVRMLERVMEIIHGGGR